MDAQHKMAREGELAEKLGALRLEEGAGAMVWSQVIEDCLAQHVRAREDIRQPPNHVAYARYHGTALVIVVAVDQVLRFERRVRQLTGDAELQKARQRFEDEVGNAASAIRDVAMHLDDYALGQGNRQTGKQGPPVRERYVRNTVYWTDQNESYISLGGDQLSIERAAHAAIQLAASVERVRDKHQQLAMRRWKAALNDVTRGALHQAEPSDGPGRESEALPPQTRNADPAADDKSRRSGPRA